MTGANAVNAAVGVQIPSFRSPHGGQPAGTYHQDAKNTNAKRCHSLVVAAALSVGVENL